MSDNPPNIPQSEEPPEPEPEGFRDEQIKAERERQKRQAEQFDQMSEDAQRKYQGVEDLDDRPGSALAEVDETSGTDTTTGSGEGGGGGGDESSESQSTQG